MKRNNTTLSICKAVAIILMCAGHAEGPTLLVTFIYLFHMPVFSSRRVISLTRST